MKWIWSLLLAATFMCTAHAQKESLPFPFNRTTRITFIRQGSVEVDAGQQFVLRMVKRDWVIERRISKTQATLEEISPERTFEILQAFSELYAHWQDRPYFNRETSGYSLFISIDDSWRMALSVKDRGSDQLEKLLEVIKYPEGLTLEEATPTATETPGLIHASAESAEDSDGTAK